jgi:hypothetical protein
VSSHALTQYAVECPRCGSPLYVRHEQSGPLDREDAKHYITNIFWQAECHNCQWESPKRSTDWALIRTILEIPRGNDTPRVVKQEPGNAR